MFFFLTNKQSTLPERFRINIQFKFGLTYADLHNFLELGIGWCFDIDLLLQID